MRSRLASGTVVIELDDLPAARAAIDDARAATTLFLGPNLDTAAALALADTLQDSGRGVAAILVQDTLDPTILRQAMRVGVIDVLTPDTTDAELEDAVARAGAEAAERMPATAAPDSAGGRPTLGRLITVFSTKGGCGKSLVASNLAILLAQQDIGDVALVDLDLQSGDLAIMLQVMPGLSIYDAAQSIERMDADALTGYLTPHDSGISLLAAPLEPSLSEAVTADAVTTMLTMLREKFAYVVVDGPAFFTDQILAAIDQSDTIVLVGSLDVPSVKNLRMAINTLHQLGHHREQLLTVLNRADSNVGLRIPEVEKSLGTAIDVRLPSSRDVPLSINQGAPLAAERRRSDVIQAIAQLVPRIAEVKVGESGGRGGLFGRRR